MEKQKPMVLFFFRGVFSAPFLGYVVYGGGAGIWRKMWEDFELCMCGVSEMAELLLSYSGMEYKNNT